MRNPLRGYTLRSRELLIVVTVLLTIGTVFYHYVERLSVLDALYFSAITLTTVGYGDISPHTSAGKLFTIFYIIGGISLMFAFLNLMARRVIKRMAVRELLERTGTARDVGTPDREMTRRTGPVGHDDAA